MKRTFIFWIIVLVLGWLFDFLFWGHAPGINFTIYVVLCLTGGLMVLGFNGFKTTWRSLILLVPIVFFAAMSFIRWEPFSMILSYGFTLGLMGLLAVTYLGGRWTMYSLADYILNFLKLAGSMISRPFLFLVENRKTTASGETPGKRPGTKRMWAIVRGILIAIPVIVIFTALLASADLVFGKQVQDFVKLFRLENLPQYIFRCIYILIGAYALAGVFLHAAQRSHDIKLVGVDKPLIAPFLGFTEAAIVMGAVVLLFTLFAGVQFRYFFGGQTNIGVQGYTYAEYARRGFTELVAVAFFSLLLFLGLSGIVKRGTTIQRRVFSGLGLGMVALVGVMLFSAFQRLVLYETAYGFSRFRLYTHVFMIWLGVLLAVVVVLDILHKERAFALAILIASLGFAVTLNLVNVDGFIVHQNVAHTSMGKELDVTYLASLSTDSVPALVAEYRDQSLPGLTRDALGAVLFCQAQERSSRKDDNWRSFTLSNRWANLAVKQVQPELDKYQVVNKDWPILILTPAGVHFDCHPSGGM